MYFNINRLKRSMLLPKTMEKSKFRFCPVQFFHAYKGLSFPKKPLIDLANRIYAAEKISRYMHVNVILCSDYIIKKLNTDFRDKARPTDVLSFNYDDEDFIGEIYISLQRAAVQSKRYGNTFGEEIEQLFIHGMFHLLGYDHETPTQRRRMKAKENSFIRA
jgi:probable rRNA maturation factor